MWKMKNKVNSKPNDKLGNFLNQVIKQSESRNQPSSIVLESIGYIIIISRFSKKIRYKQMQQINSPRT